MPLADADVPVEGAGDEEGGEEEIGEEAAYVPLGNADEAGGPVAVGSGIIVPYYDPRAPLGRLDSKEDSQYIVYDGEAPAVPCTFLFGQAPLEPPVEPEKVEVPAEDEKTGEASDLKRFKKKKKKRWPGWRCKQHAQGRERGGCEE